MLQGGSDAKRRKCCYEEKVMQIGGSVATR